MQRGFVGAYRLVVAFLSIENIASGEVQFDLLGEEFEGAIDIEPNGVGALKVALDVDNGQKIILLRLP